MRFFYSNLIDSSSGRYKVKTNRRGYGIRQARQCHGDGHGEEEGLADHKGEPEDTHTLIDSQKMLDVMDATNQLRLMLDGKLASLSVISRPSANVDGEQFAGAAQDVWQVEAVVSKYNEISAPFVSANGATSLQASAGASEARQCHQEKP